MRAPSEYRSTTGEVATRLPGVTIGGTFPRIAGVADKMAFVRSFAHNNSGHVGGTHYVNTGYDNRNIDNGGVPARPSIGSIVRPRARQQPSHDRHAHLRGADPDSLAASTARRFSARPTARSIPTARRSRICRWRCPKSGSAIAACCWPVSIG